VLSGASRIAPSRQRTLRATLDWSHELLSEAEQKAFWRLSVFAGGWTLEAAETVCPGGDVEQDDVLELLGGLIDKSLVLAGATTGGALRYRILQPIRQYATEKLQQSEEAAGVRERHAAFFLALAEQAEPELEGSRQGAWLDRLEAEHDNLRAALSWLLARRRSEPALRMGAALRRFWFAWSYLSEGIGWLERVLAEGDPATSPARVKALEGLGWLLQYQGEYRPARAAYEGMLELARTLEDKANATTALNSLGTVAMQQGDTERARAYLQENLEALEKLEEEVGTTTTTLKRFHALNLLGYLAIAEEGDYARGATLWEESLALAREAGDTERIRGTLSNLGYAEVLREDYDKARLLCDEAMALAQELGGTGVPIVASTLVNLGLATLGHGDYERARSLFEEALVIGRSAGKKAQIIETLEGMASLAGVTGEATRAARLWGAAEVAREANGVALSPGERTLHEPYLAPARSRLGETAWETTLGEGRVMSLEEAADYVLSEATIARDPSAEADLVDYLTAREREVAALASRGLTNRQVARELSISERTAGNHVAKILRKLGLSSRAQIAARTDVIVDATEAESKIAPGTMTSDE
jgi:DNA-binding CsgD family transcriptional regulator/tetratricopeptide (TPR) repeat protein